MNRGAVSGRSFHIFAGIIGGLLLMALAGLYTLRTSAQTDDLNAVSEQPVTNGKLAFTRSSAPIPSRYLYTANADGSGATPITSPGELMAAAPAWSPDGAKIAFGGTPGDIFAINANGSGQVNLTNTASPAIESDPSWSVSGKIAYAVNAQTAGGQIWTMNANGSAQAVFAGISQPAPFDPAWSPDGTRLAFVSAGEIWVINADGTNEQRVTNNATSDRDPAWSPDGLKIVFSKGGGGISIVNANGTGEAPITVSSGDKQPAFSPDGTKIAFRGTSGVWIMNPDGTDQIRIATDVINFPQCCDLTFESPAWQPVPQIPNTRNITGRVVYNNSGLAGVTVNLFGSVRASTTTDAIGNYEFSGLPNAGGFIVTPSLLRHYFTPPNRTFYNMVTDQVANFEVAGTCQGGQCYKVGKIAYTLSGEIYTIDPNGSNNVNITNTATGDGEASFSPDGSKIAFATNRDGNSEIYRMNPNGGDPVRLTNNAATDSSPSYSRDGAYIVFVSNRDGNGEIYRMNADGSNQVRLTTNIVEDYMPSVSPDGTVIFVRSASGLLHLMTVALNGTNEAEITGTNFQFFSRPSYSPDGTRILLVAGLDVTQQAIWTMNPDGTSRSSLIAAGRSPAYSPDGSALTYLCCYATAAPPPKLFAGSTAITAGSLDLDHPDWQRISVTRNAPFDFDGDGRTDVTAYRPSNGVWYILGSTAGFSYRQWSDPGDVLTPADYDGDRKTDIAVWRPSDGNFYIINSFDNTVRVENFGLAGDVPVGGDWDGDSKADPAVYRNGVGGAQSYFYYKGSMGNPQGITNFVPWGSTGDKPVVGDYDGDGRTDAAIYRNGDWWVLKSSDQQFIAVHFGVATDKLVPADYDGDGKTDLAVYRDGLWYLLQSKAGFAGFGFGIATDQPAPGDYDGDGKADAAILRDGTWWISNSGTGQPTAVAFGTVGDRPVPGAFVR